MNLKEVLLQEQPKQKKPDGTYVGVKFSRETQNAIKKFVKTLSIPNMVGREKMHTTVIYSRKYFTYEDPMVGKIDPPWKGKAKEFHVWQTRDVNKSNALVIAYTCPKLKAEHERIMKEYDATYDFPEYIPHITLSYDIGDFDTSKIDLSTFPEIEIVEEYVTDLVLDWQNKD